MTDSRSAHFDHVMGASLDLQWTARPGAVDPVSSLRDAVLRETARLERILGTHRADTELSYWLDTRGAEIPVSGDLARVLTSSLRWNAIMRGGFDPATRQDTGARPTSAPDDPPWSVSSEGSRHVAINRAATAPGLDAVVKGYVVDRVAETAAAVPGVLDVIVDLGGDIRHIGDRKVVLAVADPWADAQDGPPLTRIEVSGQAVATSGTPRSIHAMAIAPRTDDAVALAAAFTVLDPEESVALSDSVQGVACLVLDRAGGRFENERWARYEVPPPSEPPGRPMSRREMFTRFLPAWAGACGIRSRVESSLLHP